MIEVSELTKRYGPTIAVDGLTFTVRPGHVTGFLGPNGAGKSTTLRLILGLDRPTSGTALVGGQSFGRLRRGLHEAGALLDATAVPGGRTAAAHLAALARGNGLADDPGRGRPGRGRAGRRGPAPGRHVLAGHEAAARHRRRAARRSGRADLRRAGQRAGPGGHPLGARAVPPARRRRPHRPGVQPPDERDGAHRRPPDRHRPRPAHRGHLGRGVRAAGPPPARRGAQPGRPGAGRGADRRRRFGHPRRRRAAGRHRPHRRPGREPGPGRRGRRARARGPARLAEEAFMELTADSVDYLAGEPS